MTSPPSPAQLREAEAIEKLYYAALIRLGAQTLSRGLRDWQKVPVVSGPQNGRAWLRASTTAVLADRKTAQALGLAYYRLVRALRTGFTIVGPDGKDAATSLNALRADFKKAANLPMPASSGEEEVLQEAIADLKSVIAKSDTAARAEAEELLDNLGLQNLERKTADVTEAEKKSSKKKLSAKEAKAKVKQAHKEAGLRQAAEQERISLNAARGLTYDLAASDTRAIGWVRYSTTGTPCGWCAMLISRGPVYKSAKSGSNKNYGVGTRAVSLAEQDKYHTNCHCIAVPVFSEKQYENSPLFELNREYQELWPKVTRGLSGKNALAVWRKHFRESQETKKAAQEVAA